jgi:hypothetical protein
MMTLALPTVLRRGVRMASTAELAKAIADGTYHVSDTELADKLMRHMLSLYNTPPLRADEVLAQVETETALTASRCVKVA